MGDAVTPQRRLTKEQETRYKAAVSEAVAQKLAGAANFINLYQFDVKIFSLFGPYSRASLPQLGAGGIYYFPFAAEIVNVVQYIDTPGTSGTTEVDVKKSSNGGASWASIFSTTPKISSAAGSTRFAPSYDITEDLSIAAGQSWGNHSQPTGFTQGILSGGAPYNLAAGDGIKLDLIQAAAGANNYQLLIFHRPRN